MKVLFLFLFTTLSIISIGQYRPIDISKVNSLHINRNRCLDSSSSLSKFCSLEINIFKIVFYRAFYNKTTGQVQLVGRVCFSDTLNCQGIPDIDIFTANKSSNKIINRTPVGVSSESKKGLSNNGFFDIQIKPQKNLSLFFFNPSFYIEEYEIWKLISVAK